MNRRLLGGVLAAAIGVGAVLAFLSLRGGSADVVSTRPPPTAAPTAPRLLSLSIRSLPVPLVAVIGVSGAGKTTGIVIPPSLLVTIPGGGDSTIAETALRPGETLAATVSNVLGTWIGAHATTDMVGLTAIVDRVDGITLPGATSASSGEQVRSYLEKETGSERLRRWGEVLGALLAQPLRLQPSDLREPDEMEGAQAVLSQVSAPGVESLPTQQAQSRFVVADPEAVESLLSSALGIDTAPVARVAVLNGNGRPAVGESVAGALIPAGFRIVSSQNADHFKHETTQIVAQGEPARTQAERVKALLGVGRVIVVAQRSGFADITLVVGKDYKQA